MGRVRVILAAHGEAESAGFVENFQVSRHTLGHAAAVMQLSAALRLVICTVAGLRKRLRGGPGSPHNENTRRQAAALEQALSQEAGRRYRVESAFASAPPYIAEAVELPVGVDRQVVVTMIPTDSRLSCGLICRSLNAESASLRGRSTVVARLWDDPALVAIHCGHVAEHFPRADRGARGCLILVLHGTLIRDRHGRDPAFHTGATEKAAYGEALRAALLAMPDRRWQRVEIAYLNHGVGGQWSSPTLQELLERLASEGVRDVTAYAAEHLVDGGETRQLPEVLAASSMPQTRCLPCLNTSESFIDYLAERVREAAAAHRNERCCDPCPLRNGPAAD
jgi:ferrochelatase